LSRIIGNNMAVRQATQVRQRSGQVARQNASRLLRPSPIQVAELVREVVATPATLEDYQQLAEIVQDAQEQDLEFGQLSSRIQENTPFAGLLRILPENKDQAYNFANALLAAIAIIIAIVFGQRASAPTPTITPEQQEQIIERIVEHIEQNRPPEPPPTTQPPNCR
jgi:hypothetical protein